MRTADLGRPPSAPVPAAGVTDDLHTDLLKAMELFRRLQSAHEAKLRARLELGRALLGLKDRIPHRSWETHLRHYGIAVNTARRAMRLARAMAQPAVDITDSATGNNLTHTHLAEKVPESGPVRSNFTPEQGISDVENDPVGSFCKQFGSLHAAEVALGIRGRVGVKSGMDYGPPLQRLDVAPAPPAPPRRGRLDVPGQLLLADLYQARDELRAVLERLCGRLPAELARRVGDLGRDFVSTLMGVLGVEAKDHRNEQHTR